MTRCQCTRPEAIDAVRVGSVIRWNGRLRTVRSVMRCPNGHVRMVGFAKLVRSWTGRPCTHYTRSDLRPVFGGIVAHRKLPLCATDLECAVQAEFDKEPVGAPPGVTDAEMIGRVW